MALSIRTGLKLAKHPRFRPLSLSSLDSQQRDFHNLFKLKKRKNLYTILNIPRNASRKQIKKSYIQLVKLYHPDSTHENSSKAKFQEIQDAYSTLSDDEKRKKYDLDTMEDLGTRFDPKEEISHLRRMRDRTIDYEATFRKIFGDIMPSKKFDEKIEDIKYAKSYDGFQITTNFIVKITLEEAANGCKRETCIRSVDKCTRCKGRKAARGYRAIRCPFCDEYGFETLTKEPVVTKTKCRVCRGSLIYNKFVCPECEGLGYNIQLKSANFVIPPGVRNGEKLKLVIKNHVMYPEIKIVEDDYYKVEGCDVHSEAEISLAQATLGGKTKIRGLYGTLELSIPAGTSSHEVLKFDKKGLPSEDHSFGDHYVHLKIKVPSCDQLEPEMRNLFGKLAELERGTEGTVDGIVMTPQGNKYLKYEEIDSSLLARLKKALLG